MGIFKELVLLPLAPLRGTVWVADQLAQEADRRLYDEDEIRRQFVEVEIEHQRGNVTDEQRAAVEEDLLDRLAVARQRVGEEAGIAEDQILGHRERTDHG
jgi:LPS O-antigen subunit length determinant protein (WzzB/FepE family)